MDLAYLWFFIVGVLFVGYFVLDGFDFGVGMSLPFLGKDEVSRRQVINTIGPVWDLNETWVIVAGACLFAAFPEWYATLFSGFYLPLLLILLALIARGVSFEYRHQRDDLRWKRRFDWMITIGSAVPALLWGVAVANIVQGVPIDADKNFTGSLFTLCGSASRRSCSSSCTASTSWVSRPTVRCTTMRRRSERSSQSRRWSSPRAR